MRDIFFHENFPATALCAQREKLWVGAVHGNTKPQRQFFLELIECGLGVRSDGWLAHRRSIFNYVLPEAKEIRSPNVETNSNLKAPTEMKTKLEESYCCFDDF